REPVVAVRGDRYILRRPSPSETLGGGVIIDHQPKGRHKRFDEEVLKSFESLAQGSPADVLLEAAMAANIASIKEIFTRSRLESVSADEALHELIETGRLIFLEDSPHTITSDALAIALPHWNTLSDKTFQFVDSYHTDYPLRRGIPREELKSKLKLSPRIFNALINTFVARQLIIETGKSVSKPGHEIKFNGQEQAKVQALMRKFEASPFSPPSVKDCIAEVGDEVLNALIEMNGLIAVSSEVLFRRSDYDLMISRTRDTLLQNGKISLAEVRDLFSTSRKYAQALLEHLDAIGVTMRDGDFRTLKKK
ncbi:MAG: SelB C-terminal domain-containing protein, partial [Chloroflexota bacterium]